MLSFFWPQIGKAGFGGRMILKRAARVSVEKREGEGCDWTTEQR